MTITSNPSRNEYTATASQTVFNYTFKIYAITDLNVYVTPAGQTANDATDIITAYTVDPGTIEDPAGGFITLTTPATLNDLVTIVSAIPSTRVVDYQFNGDFDPDTVNLDVDRTVSLDKQSEDLINRTVTFPESEQGTSGLTLPKPVAQYFLKWSDALDGLENAAVVSTGSIITTPYTETLLDDSNASEARTTLGLGTSSTVDTGVTIGDALLVANVSSSPGLPAIDGSLLTGIVHGAAATAITFSNTDTGLTATDVQEAIDEGIGDNQERVASAWAKINGSGTPAITKGFNVASLVDNGTGDYTLNFTSNMADINYCTTTQTRRDSDTVHAVPARLAYAVAPLVGSVGIKVGNLDTSAALVAADLNDINIHIFGGE